MKIAEYNEMMAYLMRPAQQAKLVDDLEPGSLKDELLKDFDPSQETYEEYLRRKNLDRETLSEGGGQAFRLKKLQEAYDIFGQQKLDEAAKVLGFKDFTSLQGEKFANTRRKIFKELKQYGEVLPRYEADVRGRRTRIPKEQGIQIKLLEATNKKKFFDPKAFAKENKIRSEEHTSELQSPCNLVCRLLLEKKK